MESECKQLVRARLKQAGMIWDAPGAEAVATVRAWLKSARWAAALALRPARGRGYQRRLPAEVGAQVRAEVAIERAQHPWRKAWSSKRQRAQHEAHSEDSRPALVA